MREFLSTGNAAKAAVLAALVTVMAVPRLIQAGKALEILVPAAFLSMIFVCGAVTAWGSSAGMPGMITDRRTFLYGTGAAIILTLIAVPVQVLYSDPVIYSALLASAKQEAAAKAFPVALSGQIAVLLWSTGFQTMFLQAAPMSLFARLLNRRDLAIVLCLLFRAYVTHRQIADTGITAAVPLLLVSNMILTAAGCLMFARFGLAPTVILSIGLNLHLFISPPSQ